MATPDQQAWLTQVIGVDPTQYDAAPDASPPADDAPVDAAPADSPPVAAAPVDASPVDASPVDASPAASATAPAAGDDGDPALLASPTDATDTAPPDLSDDAIPLQSQSGDGGVDEAPIWHPTSSVPFDIRTDTAVDFVHQANTARGGTGEVGHMQPSFTPNPEFDSNGRITRVNMTVETTIVRPRFAGGRPNDVNRAAIKKAEELIKAHEQHHAAIALDFAARMVKAMKGKTAAAAQKAFDDLTKAMNKAQAAFDHKEGLIVVTESNAGATVDVSLGPAP